MEGVTYDVSRIERREKLREKERGLRKTIDDVTTMTKAIDEARGQMHAAIDDAYLSALEIKGQIQIIRERQQWLIGEFDKLRAEIEAIK
jgi:hypothetical protein